ncbi:MAG: hypothetical protein IPP79_12725 [Chitinophagaceae bacterium]|nr:hypothetical protein [Chitinophagaceae bacterium]
MGINPYTVSLAKSRLVIVTYRTITFAASIEKKITHILVVQEMQACLFQEMISVYSDNNVARFHWI